MMYMYFYDLCRLDKELKELERKHRVPLRWTSSDSEYRAMQSQMTRERCDSVLSSIWASSSRRQFLLQLKAKYAGTLKFHC